VPAPSNLLISVQFFKTRENFNMSQTSHIAAIALDGTTGMAGALETVAYLNSLCNIELQPTAAFERLHGRKPFVTPETQVSGPSFDHPLHVVTFAYKPVLDAARELRQLFAPDVFNANGPIVAYDIGNIVKNGQNFSAKIHPSSRYPLSYCDLTA
jgi:hypothetical protein